MEHLRDTEQHNRVRQTLAAYLRGGRLPHAVLIEGGGREERKALAAFAAKGILCRGPERPCGACRHCVKAEKEIHPDILLYGGEGGARSFHIDLVRELRQQAFVRPNEAEGKVFLLENVQDMSVQAQNALLKIIEEPPAGVAFLLLCENKSALLETILSRVTVFSLPSRESGGEPEEGGEGAHREKAVSALLALSGRRELDALEILAGCERDRVGMGLFLEAMRRVVTGLLAPEPGGPAPDVQALQGRMSRLQMLSIVAIIDETAAFLRNNGNGLLAATAFCSRVKRAFK